MASYVLKRNLDRLARTLDPTPVATLLYSDSLITQSDWEQAREPGATYERNLRVLGALERAVQMDELAFAKFLARLKEEAVYAPYVTELEAQLAQAREEKGVGKEAGVPKKGRPSIKVGMVTDDTTLLNIARDVGTKWEELGIALGMNYEILKNEVVSEASKGEHMKAFNMLRVCRSRDADMFTYEKIAAAMENCGLNSSARKYCYEAT